MKKTFINIRGGGLRVLVGIFALLALLSFVLPQAAQASTAYLTVIRNTATVNYTDTASNPMPAQSSTVDITVAYQCATPTLNQPGDQATVPGTPYDYSTYTLTSNSNGPDVYNLTAPSIIESAGISGSTATFRQGGSAITSITLGATTAAASALSTATSITIPNDDGTSNPNEVNNIKAGDTIVITIATVDYVYTVNSVNDGGGTVGGTSTITINEASFGVAIPAGTLIRERQTFTTRVTPGIVTASSDQTITVTISAIGTTACGAATDTTITTVNVANLAILKEVSPDGTAWYSTTSLPAAPQFLPGATVYYRITVTNNGTSNALATTVTDPLPPYTTYVANSTLLNGITVAGDGATSPLIAGLVVDDNVGRGALAPANGVLLPAGVATILYQVTIN